MTQLKPITIIGGGLAGLTLGIGLRQGKVPVTIKEAGRYPRHRVCGEFISGRGQAVLQKYGLMDTFEGAGAIRARTAKFFLGRAASPVRWVNPPAVCLSRFVMDRLLAQRFQELGGDLLENHRCEQELSSEGIVRASGRQARTVEKGWRWFGLKIHAKNVELEADLEMHGSAEGYVGLCRLPGGETNVCGLFRAQPGIPHPAPMDLLRGFPGSRLGDRLAHAIFDETSFCSVAGLSLEPQRALDQGDFRIGDALTMIPPVTGNGMSMAFEGADLILPPVLRYARGDLGWKDACREAASKCDTEFRQRLVWAKRLQGMMFSSILRGGFGSLLLSSEKLWRLIFDRTR